MFCSSVYFAKGLLQTAEQRTSGCREELSFKEGRQLVSRWTYRGEPPRGPHSSPPTGQLQEHGRGEKEGHPAAEQRAPERKPSKQCKQSKLVGGPGRRRMAALEDPILFEPTEDPYEKFHFGKEVGRGNFGVCALLRQPGRAAGSSRAR